MLSCQPERAFNPTRAGKQVQRFVAVCSQLGLQRRRVRKPLLIPQPLDEKQAHLLAVATPEGLERVGFDRPLRGRSVAVRA